MSDVTISMQVGRWSGKSKKWLLARWSEEEDLVGTFWGENDRPETVFKMPSGGRAQSKIVVFGAKPYMNPLAYPAIRNLSGQICHLAGYLRASNNLGNVVGRANASTALNGLQ